MSLLLAGIGGMVGGFLGVLASRLISNYRDNKYKKLQNEYAVLKNEHRLFVVATCIQNGGSYTIQKDVVLGIPNNMEAVQGETRDRDAMVYIVPELVENGEEQGEVIT